MRSILILMFVLAVIFVVSCGPQTPEPTEPSVETQAQQQPPAEMTKAEVPTETPEEPAQVTEEAAEEPAQPTEEPKETTEEKNVEATPAATELKVNMTTSKGLIVLKLFPDKAPVTVANFVNLAKHGYYDGITFHRVIADFMIQGGDPTGTGRGGPGYQFEDEFDPSLQFDRAGLLAMANAGPGTNGSQFFITHVPTPHLNNRHTIFGEVLQGQEVVDAIQQGDKMEKVEIEGDASGLLAEQGERVADWNRALQ